MVQRLLDWIKTNQHKDLNIVKPFRALLQLLKYKMKMAELSIENYRKYMCIYSRSADTKCHGLLHSEPPLT